MKHTIVIAAIVLAGGLAGCASPSTNMRIGGEQSYLSLQAQREAVRAIVDAPEIPNNAIATGPVDASRCHRYQGDIEPSQEQLMDDLKAAAYARGADGIAGVTIVKESGLMRNCWYIFTARGTMFRVAR